MNYTYSASFHRSDRMFFLYSSGDEMNYKLKFQNMVQVVKETKQPIHNLLQ